MRQVVRLMSGKSGIRVALVLWGAGVLAATLTPTSAPQPGTPLLCIICGSRGVADAIMNVLLFAPLGAALTLLDWGRYRPIFLAAALSAAIELAQLEVPGRDPSVGDVIFNFIGAGVGVLLVLSGGRWLRTGAAVRERLYLAGLALAVGVPALTGYLLEPVVTDAPLRVEFTPRLLDGRAYEGRVIEFNSGPWKGPVGQLSRSQGYPTTSSLGTPLRVRAIAGSAARDALPIVRVVDGRGRHLLSLSTRRRDVVFRHRTRAAALRLDQPEIRLDGALRGVSPGDTIEITVSEDGGYCMAVNESRRCGLGPSVASGWGVLLYSPVFPAWLEALLSLAWMAAVVLPLGLWIYSRASLAVAVALLLASFLLVPMVTVLTPVGLPEVAGAAAGLWAGTRLRERVGRLKAESH